MARNKSNEFPPDQQDLASWAKALGHPARIAILQTLAEKGTCICGDLVGVLPLAQPTVSQHLRELKDAGLIKGEIDGAKSCYCIDKENLMHLFAAMNKFKESLSLDKAFNNCC
ncbi:MAG: winged helix-turn-helix domain-containing protein [Bacteroidetes bacterium]|nr:winged helix-turn-helix domain-containing protein [Bacteroidota bacterium]